MKIILILIVFSVSGMYAQTKPKPVPDNSLVYFIIKYDKEVEALAKVIYKVEWNKVYYIAKIAHYFMISPDMDTFYREKWANIKPKLRKLIVQKELSRTYEVK